MEPVMPDDSDKALSDCGSSRRAASTRRHSRAQGEVQCIPSRANGCCIAQDVAFLDIRPYSFPSFKPLRSTQEAS